LRGSGPRFKSAWNGARVFVRTFEPFSDFRLEPLQSGGDLFRDREEGDCGRNEARLPRLFDDRAALRARGKLGRGRRVRLLRDDETLRDPPLRALVAVRDLEDELVLPGIEIAPHRERDLVRVHFAGRHVESILEVVDQPVALDDLADHVDVVEVLFPEVPGPQVLLGHEE
jgi:hypothetical protein